MVTPDTRPALVIEGPLVVACRINPTTVEGGGMADAWQLMARRGIVNTDPVRARTYLCRMEHEGRQAITLLHVDDLMLRDARKAGLPDTIAFDTQLLITLPEHLTTAEGRWLLRMLTRSAVARLPLPIRVADQRAQWRGVLDVLIDVLAVNPMLTSTL